MLKAGADIDHERFENVNKICRHIFKNSPFPILGASNYLNSPDDVKKDYEVDNAVFKSTYLKLGGRITWHFPGNVPRFVPNDFRLYSKCGRGVDWRISYDYLEPYYLMAEKEWNISATGKRI